MSRRIWTNGSGTALSATNLNSLEDDLAAANAAASAALTAALATPTVPSDVVSASAMATAISAAVIAGTANTLRYTEFPTEAALTVALAAGTITTPYVIVTGP